MSPDIPNAGAVPCNAPLESLLLRLCLVLKSSSFLFNSEYTSWCVLAWNWELLQRGEYQGAHRIWYQAGI